MEYTVNINGQKMRVTKGGDKFWYYYSEGYRAWVKTCYRTKNELVFWLEEQAELREQYQA